MSRFTKSDLKFLRDCGVSVKGLRSIRDVREALLECVQLFGIPTPDELNAQARRDAQAKGLRFARFMRACQETNLERVLATYEAQVGHDAEIQACADRIARHDAPGIPEDGTVKMLRLAGVPVTAENWLNLQWMGHPPTPPYDGEFLAELPDWVRQALEELEQEVIEERPEQFRTGANEDNEEEN